MKKYKYITIKKIENEMFEKFPVYIVFNIKWHIKLGIISYYKSWKQYVFRSQYECVFNKSCLRDVLDFMENAVRRKTTTIRYRKKESRRRQIIMKIIVEIDSKIFKNFIDVERVLKYVDVDLKTTEHHCPKLTAEQVEKIEEDCMRDDSEGSYFCWERFRNKLKEAGLVEEENGL